MHPSFTIYQDNTNGQPQQLFAETGRHGVSFFTLDGDRKTFTGLATYHFTAGTTNAVIADQLKEIFAEEKLLQPSYQKIDIIYSFPESILTPHEVFGDVDTDQMLNMVFGDLHENVLKTDFIYRHNLHNVYRIPLLVNAAIEQQFPVSNYTHQYSLLTHAFETDGLFAIFYPQAVTLLLRAGGKLQVIQQFDYITAEDAAYHLLNVCRSFKVAASDTTLILHGMIDKDSALFIEVYKYFLNVEFAALPDGLSYAAQVKEYPAHYFSHLFATAACV